MVHFFEYTEISIELLSGTGIWYLRSFKETTTTTLSSKAHISGTNDPILNPQKVPVSLF